MNLQEVLKSIDKHIWTSEPEVGYFIASLMRMHKVKNSVEVGTFKGFTSCCMIDATPTDGTFISIDVEEHRQDSVKQYFTDNKAKFILQDSFKALDELPTRSADLIFLDSFHSYEQVKGEFKRAERIIKQGGLILMHDYYSAEGVKQWCEEIRPMPWFEMAILNTTEDRGLVIVRTLHNDYPKQI